MNTKMMVGLCAALVAAGFCSLTSVRAQAPVEPTNAPAPTTPPTPDLREQFKNMTPEERRAKYLELRKSGALGGPTNPPTTLQERRGRIDELRKQRGTNLAPTLESWRTNRPGDRLEELRRKKKDKTITPGEQQQLDRAEAFLSRMQQATNANGTLQAPKPLTNAVPNK